MGLSRLGLSGPAGRTPSASASSTAPPRPAADGAAGLAAAGMAGRGTAGHGGHGGVALKSISENGATCEDSKAVHSGPCGRGPGTAAEAITAGAGTEAGMAGTAGSKCGLPFNMLALITSECGATRSLRTKLP